MKAFSCYWIAIVLLLSWCCIVFLMFFVFFPIVLFCFFCVFSFLLLFCLLFFVFFNRVFSFFLKMAKSLFCFFKKKSLYRISLDGASSQYFLGRILFWIIQNEIKWGHLKKKLEFQDRASQGQKISSEQETNSSMAW